MASTSSAILAHWSSCFLAILVYWSSYFLANPSHLWAGSASSWALARVMLCICVRAGLRLGPSSVCELSSGMRREGRGRNQQQHKIWQAVILCIFPTMLSRGMDRLLAPCHPSHMAGWLDKNGNSLHGHNQASGIVQLTSPLKEWWCPDKGNQKTSMGGKMNWQVSSPLPHLVQDSLTKVRWKVLPMAPPLPGSGDRR